MFTFHLYGFFVGLGIVAALLIIERVQEKFKIVSFQLSVVSCLLWVLIPGLICARLYHVVDYWGYYSQDPIRTLYIWQGGMGIYGGILGGTLGLFAFSVNLNFQRLKKKFSIFNFQFSKDLFSCSIVSLLNLVDLAAFGLPVGQAIGRLGNFFNQELYGLPTSLSWGIYINPSNRLPGYDQFSHFQPLFAYEAIWDMAIFIILIKIANLKCKVQSAKLQRKPQKLIDYKPGLFFFTYLFLYGFGRFWLEFLRINPWRVGEIDVAQGISLGLMGISLVWFTSNKLLKSLK